MSKETYQQGMIDAIQMWGTVCGGHNCENCAIGSVRNTNVSCQEFARKHPEKMLSLLTELNEEESTYYSEYMLRFPHNELSVDELSQMTCRKVVFGGDLSCDLEIADDDVETCKNCWLQRYTGDDN